MAPNVDRKILKNQVFPPEADFRDLCSFLLPFGSLSGPFWFPFGSNVDEFRTIRDPFGLHFASFWSADLKLIRTRFSNGLDNHFRGRNTLDSISDNLRFVLDRQPAKMINIICCEATHQNRKHLRTLIGNLNRGPRNDRAATMQRPCGDRAATLRRPSGFGSILDQQLAKIIIIICCESHTSKSQSSPYF
jgi:hypothetical protein